jgi:hypothetical protein
MRKFKVNTPLERIEFLRSAIRECIEAHGVPCTCRLCEALLFDAMSADGQINLVTGQRNAKKK